MTRKAKKIFSFSSQLSSKSQLLPSKEEFWALKDVSFEIEQGDRVGIIGRNGAGKSTLLKLLSRITEPTSGNIKIKGRVASLLEVGTGFHPELTGRENIFLNGAILGMSRAEIKKHFDAIVEFAEIEKFLDTPVKRYSSGMYVRLAFAVAAHMEPEILVVDEVLAVGDAQFQKKCLGKMEDVSKNEGRTVLFVSHNTAALIALCNKGIVLNNGSKIFEDNIVSAVGAYNELSLRELSNTSKSFSNNLIIEELVISPRQVWSLDDLNISVNFKTADKEEVFQSLAIIITKAGKRIGILDLRHEFAGNCIKANQSFQFKARIKSLPLVEGDYEINIYVEATSAKGDFTDLAQFSVMPRKYETGDYVPYDVSVKGSVEFMYDVELIP
jgi:lipopolysaccharide transport system ATP-binding protein